MIAEIKIIPPMKQKSRGAAIFIGKNSTPFYRWVGGEKVKWRQEFKRILSPFLEKLILVDLNMRFSPEASIE